MTYRIGVDLGTTSVRAAVCDGAGVRVVTLGDRSAESPAAVYLHGDGSLITGRRAASRSVTNPGRVARGFTRLLGGPESVVSEGQPSVVLGGHHYSVSELLAALLGNVVQRVSEVEGGPPDAAVLTHPVSWGPPALTFHPEWWPASPCRRCELRGYRRIKSPRNIVRRNKHGARLQRRAIDCVRGAPYRWFVGHPARIVSPRRAG